MIKFIKNAKQIAHQKMDDVNAELSTKFSNIIEFLSQNTDAAPEPRNQNIITGSEEHIEKLAHTFSNSRTKKPPSKPQTQQDMMVLFILENYFNVPTKKINKAISWHRYAMGAENIIGELLERYIADNLEDEGWIWCSGSIVKSVDFIYPDQNNNWRMLQIKNRDNSEKSSSAAIRNHTSISKWYRTFSKKPGDNWNNFPITDAQNNLSENGFREFVNDYLTSIKEDE